MATEDPKGTINIAVPAQPKMGGAIASFGNWSPAGPNGSAEMSLPLPISAAPNRSLVPNIGLNYSSQVGSGMAGMGWHFTVDAITVRTSKGVPVYEKNKDVIVGPGGAGANSLLTSGNPLVEALSKAYGGSTWMGSFVNLVGLAGLIASFFSIIYAYSRQIFALSRAGYLPRKLSETNKSKAPVLALVIPGIIGFGLSLTGQGDLLILVAVFGATLSYVLMMAAHITLRIRRPKMERPYRTPGGIFTSGVALVLACIAVVAGFLVDPRVVIGAAVIYGVLIAYFAFYSRHHLVAGTPEEEFAAIQKAEEALH